METAAIRGKEGTLKMWGKLFTGCMAAAAVFSACCVDDPVYWWKFLIVFGVSTAWCAGYAFVHGCMYRE